MALVPLLLTNWWDRPHHLLDQDFGLELHPEQLVAPTKRLELYLEPRRCPMNTVNYIRPWAEFLRQGDRGVSTIQADKDQFQVTLDVQQFKPEEIDVKVVDKFVVVNAKHEEKQDDHGWISREFTRKYLIPEQCNIEKVESKLSSDGVLTITAPRKEEPKDKNERVIRIEQTGKPALKPKGEEKKVEEKVEKKVEKQVKK